MSASPTLLIGNEDGPFFQVRAGHRFDDGTIVVANGSTRELFFYSPDGIHLRTVGGEGGGPEEFGYIGSMGSVGDSIYIFDQRNQRITLLSRSGAFGRSIPIPPDMGGRRVVDANLLGDGSIFLRAGHSMADLQPGPKSIYESGYRMKSGAEAQELGRFYGAQTYWHALDDGGLLDSGVPFAPKGHLIVRQDALYYSGGEEYRVQEYDLNGNLEVVYAFAGERQPIRAGDLDRLLDRELGPREEPSRVERLLRQVPLPDRMPAYADLKIDHEGNVWASPHAGTEPATCWHVYQRRPLEFAELCLPEQFEVLDIGSDWVLGVLRDEFGVERVALFGVERDSESDSIAGIRKQ